MLKKNDLVTRFEQVVKQEIINHNNSIARSNNSINDIRDELHHFMSHVEHKLGELNSADVLIGNRLQNLQQVFGEQIQTIFTAFTNINERIDCIEKKIKETNALFVDLSKSIVDFSTHKNETQLAILSIYKSQADLKQDFNASLLHIEKLFIKKLGDAVENLSLPSQLQIIQKKFLEKIEDLNFAFNSIREEHEILKKEFYVNKKYVEYVQNNIHRLKNSSEVA